MVELVTLTRQTVANNKRTVELNKQELKGAKMDNEKLKKNRKEAGSLAESYQRGWLIAISMFDSNVGKKLAGNRK